MRKKKNNTSALVVEGGGMRGIFAAGILDTFLEEGFDPFDLYLGVSAGACDLSSHIAGQHGRNYRIFTDLMTKPQFMDMRRFLRGGHFMDLDYLWDAIAREEPLDVPSIIRSGKRFLIIATNVETGSPSYLPARESTCLDHLKASSAIPLIYRGFPRVEGVDYTDGGVTDPIPVIEAYRRGAKRIMVIRSRPKHFYKTNTMETALVATVLWKRPYLASAVRNQIRNYARCVNFILNPPADCLVLSVSPGESLKSGRTTREREHLLEDYRLGKEIGLRAIREWNGGSISGDDDGGR